MKTRFLDISTRALAGLLLAGCNAATIATPTPLPTPTPTASPAPTASPSPSQSPAPTASPTPSPTATPVATLPPSPSPSPSPTPAIGLPGPTCINGWQTLPADDPKYIEGLQILTSYMGLADPLTVDDMRYFVGPDPDNIISPHYEHVERWYFKATLSTDPTYRGRWLIEKRTDSVLGVSGVAPYDTIGYTSPDWSGFEGEGTPRAIDGLPGLWSGIRYDFVTGAGDSGFPSLPESQSECLAGT